MSKTYCREDCRTCEWVATTLEGVRPYWFCDAEGVFADSEALRYCPSCGTRLLPNGDTEEMVSKRVALNVAAQSGRPQRWACPVKCGECCSRLTFAQCAERRLAYAEQQAAGGRPE